MARNRFIDPSGAVSPYDWDINHSDEQEFGKERNLDSGGNSGNTGLIVQQSDESPQVIQVSGVILTKAQMVAMNFWFELCDEQTIYFRDFTNDKFEVIITAFKPVRKRTIKNPRDYANAPLWYWTYDLSMQVMKVITSDIWSES